jgi:hypothetical protein
MFLANKKARPEAPPTAPIDMEPLQPLPPPRARSDQIDLVAGGCQINLFAMRTEDALEVVLAPDYFANVNELKMRVGDRIEIIAAGRHATLAVSSIADRRIRVRLLWKENEA